MNSEFFQFIDESGVAHLNNRCRYFILTSIIIRQEDFLIIEGYLRLLKRKHGIPEDKVIHTTDLFERPYQNYRSLHVNNRLNSFVHDLAGTLATVPYNTYVYYVDKDSLRKSSGYRRVRRSSQALIDPNTPYRMAAIRAMQDFTQILISNKASGQIVIESRLNSDKDFVEYFDVVRKEVLPGGKRNVFATDAKKRINALLIASKHLNNGGLEIADIAAYSSYRELIKDPQNLMKLSLRQAHQLHAVTLRKTPPGVARESAQMIELSFK